MADRLEELRQLNGGDVNIQMEENNMNQSVSEANGILMKDFNKLIKEINYILESIKKNNENIKQLNRDYEKATLTSKEKEASNQLNEIINQNTKSNMRLKDLMNQISIDVENARTVYPDDPETLMKINLQKAVSTKTKDILSECQELQMNFRADMKEKVTRQAKYVDPTISDDQIKEICEDPEKGGKLLQEKMFGTASIQLQNAVADIQDKFRDIKHLEENVNIVYQMFVDMALLVHQQGEMIDNIEININDAKNYVEKGEKQLDNAKKNSIAARKKMCCITIIGLVVLAVILGPTLGSLK